MNVEEAKSEARQEMELTSPTYLLIEANLFIYRGGEREKERDLALPTHLLSSYNAFPSSGVQLSLHTLPPLLRGPFLTLQTSTFARTPGGAYFLLFQDTFESAAANSLRIDNAKRISCQWGGGEPISCEGKDEGEGSRSTKTKKSRGLSSYWRRIELRFLSNSEDRTNLKSAGSRR